MERREHSDALKRLRSEVDRLNHRLQAVYEDKLDGKVSEELYDRISRQWKEEVRRCEDELVRCQEASETYMDEGVALLVIARNAHKIFETQRGTAQRKLLNFVLQNCIWQNGQLTANFRQPFDMLEETAAKSSKPQGADGYDDAGKENWLGN
ncbi:hypothetical protein [Asticcacaulis machinosus]|uniref:Uncharacterized protein n=1 Tax=Asticcacaulis machinosus TaxID=2984211 RepID=A0ABT5HF90_9CAUL|nr:hypothetical protein [Asticcacaulis machinosus]MDC7674924.1 hypothetical protein [Asticcacaulis machinosus]